MKESIDGKIYDTEKSEQLYHWDNGLRVDDDWYRLKNLYLTGNGKCFVEYTDYSLPSVEQSETSDKMEGRRSIKPVNEQEAIEFLVNHGEFDMAIDHFTGSVTEHYDMKRLQRLVDSMKPNSFILYGRYKQLQRIGKVDHPYENLFNLFGEFFIKGAFAIRDMELDGNFVAVGMRKFSDYSLFFVGGQEALAILFDYSTIDIRMGICISSVPEGPSTDFYIITEDKDYLRNVCDNIETEILLSKE